jgi:FAD synthase
MISRYEVAQLQNFFKMENILLSAHFYGTSMSVTFLERILEQKENEGFSALFRAPFTDRTQKFLKCVIRLGN